MPKCSGFNTQPPEGGWNAILIKTASRNTFQHTAARRRLVPSARNWIRHCVFQHTAARRRLGSGGSDLGEQQPVSTHSRPKAAGTISTLRFASIGFQHTAARRRLALPSTMYAGN
ncbi:hypothetical protein [Neisseria sicca]|uniref:hypothetical protein n=1 Tax=Neisseria sicca TaxID=490 RepID=UPI000A9522D0